MVYLGLKLTIFFGETKSNVHEAQLLSIFCQEQWIA